MITGKNIYIIGSIKNMDSINRIKKYVEDLYGKICFIDSVKPRPGWGLESLIEECFEKIESAEVLIIVTEKDGSIDNDVTYEKVFAYLYSECFVVIVNPYLDLKSQFGVMEQYMDGDI